MYQKRLRSLGAGAVAALAIAVTLFVIGCSGDSNKSNSSSSSSGTSSAGTSGELRIPGDDPLTLDPALVTDTSSATYVVEIFSGLVTLDKSLKVVPDVAKEWTVSDDGKTYTFKLRDGVVFQNSGRKVTAADFKYSMERSADPKTASPVAETYLGDIVGAKEMIDGKATEISGVKVIDDSTLQITIDEPKPYFLAKLTYPTAFLMDKEQIAKEGKNWTRKPNGTGPFALQEYKVGEKVVLVANDKYYGDTKPQLSKVTFNLAGGSVLTQYENGEVDIAGVGINDIERLRDKKEPLNKEFIEKPTLDVTYIAFNTKQAPFDDPKVRQAFGAALDKDRIAKVIAKDLALPANAILPPGMPAFNAQQKGITFDASTAKQLLAESKYAGKMPRVVMTMPGTGTNVGPVIESMLEMWKQNLGVTVEVEQVETATFYQDVQQKKYQMWIGGWAADYPDPENFLDIHFYTTSPQNDTAYSNPQVDALLKKARTEKDNPARMKEYQDVEGMILQDAPWIPFLYGDSAVVVKPYVKGWEPTPMIIPMLKYISIQK
jgi:oligopeptide transport system substrate-binding protein